MPWRATAGWGSPSRVSIHTGSLNRRQLGPARIDHYRWAIDQPFVINLAEAPAIGAPRGATFIKLEPDGMTWPDTGINVQVMQPGEPAGRYHSEPVQEDFLVLYGECIAVVDDEERALRQWDFLHCPAGSGHAFVGAGD